MSGFPILDLVVGIIFVYFLLGVISSSAIEIILTGLKARARLLEDWLFKIFDKDVPQKNGGPIKLGQAIMDHCSVTGLSTKGKSTSYIDAKNFTSALLEKVTFDAASPTAVAKDIDEFVSAITKTDLLSTELQRVLLTYANEAKDTYNALTEKTVSEMELFRGKIENWYDSSMERLTGQLKKKYSRPATFVVAVVVTIFLNADSIALAKYLYSNPDARAKIASQAYSSTNNAALIEEVNQLKINAVNTSSKDSTLAGIKDSIIKNVQAIDKAKGALSDVMPLTWKPGELKSNNGQYSARLIFNKIIGLLVTILAIMMGAPFWFDMLNKISNLRSTGAKPALASSEEEKKRGG